MPRFRVRTIELRPCEVIYDLEASDKGEAVAIAVSDGVAPARVSRIKDSEERRLVRVKSCRLLPAERKESC